MVILIIFAVSESSFLVTYFSRFSEEVFTGIVVCFFIYEASKNLVDVSCVCHVAMYHPMLHNITLSCDLMWNLARRSLLYCNYCMQYDLFIM